jgi:hypothetical protein
MVNGELLTETRPLRHGDRVLFGSHHYFIYCDPTVNPEEMVDWEEAMKEANKEQMAMGGVAAVVPVILRWLNPADKAFGSTGK